MNAICLSIDRLSAAHLGAYGNTYLDTPAFDRLAGESLVCEQALIESPMTDAALVAFWHGIHGARCTGGDAPTADVSLPAALAQSGVQTILLTDRPELLDHPLSAGFSQRLLFTSADDPPPEMPAEEIAETRLAGRMAELIELVERLIHSWRLEHRRFFLWCDLTVFGTVWDAPMELRRLRLDEDDPPASDMTTPPQLALGPDVDPDELLPITEAHAAQLLVLDACLGAMLDALEDCGATAESLLLLTAPRGMPLGEHGYVGPGSTALYQELVQVPLMIRSNGQGDGVRSQAIVQPCDVFTTLAARMGVADRVTSSVTGRDLSILVEDDAADWRDAAYLAAPDRRAVRTPLWLLLQSDRNELYVKPDDRFELNEVADRCPGEVAELRELLSKLAKEVRGDR